mgnify:CR=1 FL=1
MTSPTLRSLSSVDHFFLLGRLGLHFFNQRCKKCLTNSWTLLHLFFGLKFFWGELAIDLSNQKVIWRQRCVIVRIC